MNEIDLISDLVYISYRHNRTISPEVHPYEWAKVYGHATAALEMRLFLERAEEQRVREALAQSRAGNTLPA